MSGFLCGKVVKDRSISIKDKLDLNGYSPNPNNGKDLVNFDSLNSILGNLSLNKSGNYLELKLGNLVLSNVNLCPLDCAEINDAPTVNAGIDKQIQLPTNSITTTASAVDPNGDVMTYQWYKISGGAGTIVDPTSLNTDITGLEEGNYTFRITATDINGASSSDSFDLVVLAEEVNVPPIVNVGNDKTITLPTNSVSVNATAVDPDGDSMTYEWTKESGGTATITDPNSLSTDFTNLVEGTYVFKLTATDSEGNSGSDTLTVTVIQASNQRPTANAGADKSITSSTTTLTGSGSDSDGTIVSYRWTKISNLPGNIDSPNSRITTLSGLVEGTHTFRLTVTDNNGATDSDDVNVTVYSTSPRWVYTGNFNCSTSSTSNVGTGGDYSFAEQRDENPYSSTNGDRRWIRYTMGDGNCTSSDDTPPTLNVDWKEQNQVVDGSVTIDITVSDNVSSPSNINLLTFGETNPCSVITNENTNNPTITFVSEGTCKIHVIATDEEGNVSSEIFTYIVGSKPLTASIEDIGNNQIKATVSGGTPPYNIFWELPSCYSYTSISSNIIQLECSNSGDCQNEIIFISVLDQEVVDPVLSNELVTDLNCNQPSVTVDWKNDVSVGETVTPTVTVDQTGVTYEWISSCATFNDDSVKEPVITFNQAGNCRVTLRVTNEDGRETTRYHDYNPTEAPVITNNWTGAVLVGDCNTTSGEVVGDLDITMSGFEITKIVDPSTNQSPFAGEANQWVRVTANVQDGQTVTFASMPQGTSVNGKIYRLQDNGDVIGNQNC